jgi:hypothetical protein
MVVDHRRLSGAAPDRSVEQRREALELANEVRSQRAALKRDLKAGRLGFLELLAKTPEWLLSARVYDIVLACPRAGRAKVDKAFALARVSPAKTFAGITYRQRADLLRELARFPSLRELTRRRER